MKNRAKVLLIQWCLYHTAVVPPATDLPIDWYSNIYCLFICLFRENLSHMPHCCMHWNQIYGTFESVGIFLPAGNVDGFEFSKSWKTWRQRSVMETLFVRDLRGVQGSWLNIFSGVSLWTLHSVRTGVSSVHRFLDGTRSELSCLGPLSVSARYRQQEKSAFRLSGWK